MDPGLTIETWLGRLVLAVVLGGIIGFERQYRGRPAGLRTHIVVCLGAALITIASVGWMLSKTAAGEGVMSDPARVAAGVVTGIGFLGAGVIMRARDSIRGLTTAASIWFTAGLGIIIGFGFTLIAVAAMLIEQITLIGLAFLERFIPPLHYRNLQVTATGNNFDAVEKSCRSALAGFDINVYDFECEAAPADNQVKLIFHLQFRGQRAYNEIVHKLGLVGGVRHIAWQLTLPQA